MTLFEVGAHLTATTSFVLERSRLAVSDLAGSEETVERFVEPD